MSGTTQRAPRQDLLATTPAELDAEVRRILYGDGGPAEIVGLFDARGRRGYASREERFGAAGPRVERNMPCPCGCGAKAKRCRRQQAAGRAGTEA